MLSITATNFLAEISLLSIYIKFILFPKLAAWFKDASFMFLFGWFSLCNLGIVLTNQTDKTIGIQIENIMATT